MLLLIGSVIGLFVLFSLAFGWKEPGMKGRASRFPLVMVLSIMVAVLIWIVRAYKEGSLPV